MGRHGEGLCLETRSLVSLGRSLYFRPQLSPSFLLAKPRTLPVGLVTAPFSTTPKPRARPNPWASNSVFRFSLTSQWCLDDQEPENSTALASSNAQGPLKQLWLSHISDCLPTLRDVPQCSIRAQNTLPCPCSPWRKG